MGYENNTCYPFSYLAIKNDGRSQNHYAKF